MGIVVALGLAAATAVGPDPSHPPFDLTHLPAVGPQGLLGFRPAALAGGATTWGPFGDPWLFAVALGGALEINATAAAGPAPAEVAECVVGVRIAARVEKIPPDERGHERSFVLAMHTHTGLVRTVGPFDWAGRLRKWFPNGRPAAHAGRDYLVVPFRADGRDDTLAFYCPDGRTAVFGSVAEIEGLIDRVKADRAGPKPPPGWDEVTRAAVAVAAVADDQPWLTVDPAVKSLGPLEEVRDLTKSFDRLTVAVPTPARVRLTFAAKDAAAATVVEATVNRLLAKLRGLLADGDPGRAGLFAYTVTADGTAVRVETPSLPGLVRSLWAPKDEQ